MVTDRTAPPLPTHAPARRRRLNLSPYLYGAIAFFVLALIALWLGRVQVAQSVVERTFIARGVPATYQITQISPRTQRIENLVMGDPKAPDLTAKWVEIDLAPSATTGLKLAGLRAHGIRARARITNKGISFGVLDRLIPETTEAFRLPDVDTQIQDTRLFIAMPQGVIGVSLDGSGNPVERFWGRAVAVSGRVGTHDCMARGFGAVLNVAVRDGAPTLTGPARIARMTCAGTQITPLSARMNLALPASLDRWRGGAQLALQEIETGTMNFNEAQGAVDFDGNRTLTTGGYRLSLGQARLPRQRAGLQAARVEGRWRFGMPTQGPGAGRASFRANGQATLERLTILGDLMAGWRRAGTAAGPTPFAPLLTRMTPAIQGLNQGITARARFALMADMPVGEGKPARTLFMAEDLNVQAGPLAARLSGPAAIRLTESGLQAAGGLSITGGGVPSMTTRLAFDGREARGTLAIAPIAANGTALAFGPLTYRFDALGNAALNGIVAFDGAVGGYRISRLGLPLAITRDSAGEIRIGKGCQTVRLGNVSGASLRMNPGALALCPMAGETALARFADGQWQGGSRLRPFAFQGQMNATPFRLAGQGADLELARARMHLAPIALSLGGAYPFLIRLEGLEARLADGVPEGTLNGLSAHALNPDVVLEQGAGQWRYTGGRLALKGRFALADRAGATRFNRIVAQSLVVEADASTLKIRTDLAEAITRTPLADISIDHDLDRGTGQALIAMPGIRFTRRFQPENLSPLVLGKVADVDGVIRGEGRFSWTPGRMSSNGFLKLDNLDLASTSGPVKGLRGTITFLDLVDLKTPPNQKVHFASVNPGLPVTNGDIFFQLLGGRRLAVEGSTWPIAGGLVSVDPTILPLEDHGDKRITIRIKGVEAVKFIPLIQLENIYATGLFDGVIPVVMGKETTRIEGGFIAARAPGGTLAFTGPMSDEQLNYFGNLAFEALKSMTFNTLKINLDGRVDGEMVSSITLTGLARDPTRSHVPRFFRKLFEIPMVFNIKMKGPFIALGATVRGIRDPRLVVHRALPLPAPVGAPPPVSPSNPEVETAR